MLSSISTTAAILLLGSVPAPQDFTDLLGEDPEENLRDGRPVYTVVNDRNRTDLHLVADVVPSVTGRDRGRGEFGISANFDAEFICGKFDLRGTFENLLGKEVREEFLQGLLGYVESEVTGSAMELLCQAQPTLCTLLQNHNIAANLKLGYHYDRCAQIQNAVDHAQKRIYASAVEQCLREKQAAGVPLDVAIDSCRRAEQVRGFGGEALAEFDLGHELKKFIDLPAASAALLDSLAEDLRYGGTWSSSNPDPDAMTRVHDELRTQYAEKWEEMIDRVHSGKTLWESDLKDLAPRNAPGISPGEVVGIAKLPPFERRAAVSSLTSAAALLELMRQIHEVERGLEALSGAPTLEKGQRELLKNRLDRLRSEQKRLGELYKGHSLYTDAYLRVKYLADRDYYARLGRQRARERAERRRDGLHVDFGVWGGRNVPRRTQPRGASGGSHTHGSGDCSGCGLNYQVGATGN